MASSGVVWLLSFLRAGPTAVAVNADSQGKSFDWCVFAWFIFALLAHDSLAGGYELVVAPLTMQTWKAVA